MKLVSIGFGNLVAKERIVAVVSSDSATIRFMGAESELTTATMRSLATRLPKPMLTSFIYYSTF